MKRTGPNDTKHVVWAISEFFFSLLSVFFIFTNYLKDTNDILKLWTYIWQGMMKRMGPNDVFRIVWAFSEFFYIIICVFYIY